MELNSYQKQAMTTCMDSSKNVAYMYLNLVGEVGELTEKMLEQTTKPANHQLKIITKACSNYGAKSKQLRNNPDTLDAFEVRTSFERVRFADEQSIKELQKEAGDILWQLSGLCSVMGWELEDIAQQNLDKLASRQQRNVIDGNGDNR